MTLRKITDPAVEPITLAELMAWCRIDASNQEPPPGSMTVALASPAAAGNCTAGAHRLLATFVTADGETDAGAVSGVVTVADAAVNGQIAVSAIPIGGALVTSRKIYMAASGGSTYLLAATIANNTATTATINVADGSLGAEAPATNTTSDPMLLMMIKGARTVAEDRTGRSLITQTWELVLDEFPENEIRIGMMPVQSITWIKYYDEAGDLQTLSAADYALDGDTIPGWVLPAEDVDWPATRDMAQSVIVRFVAGYGDTSASVPSEIRMWIAAQVSAMLNSPDGMVSGSVQPERFIDSLLDSYRIRLYA